MLVATSIGEEGLDIGEVDLIVCYDAQKTPIRMVSPVPHASGLVADAAPSCNALVVPVASAQESSTFCSRKVAKS